MRTLKTRTTSIIQQSIPYLKASNKTYFNQVGFAVANKWKIVRPFRKLVHRPSNVTEHDVRNKSGFAMQPCMEAIHGSGGSAQCNITNECWKLMTRTDGMGYTLTHQALYYMFAQQINGETVYPLSPDYKSPLSLSDKHPPSPLTRALLLP